MIYFERELLVSERKFLFASSVVGYSTCHWCHVMERESFESEEIAKILNEKFVSVKVDREERPDVDKVYMTYIQVSVMKYTLIYFIRSCSRKHLYVYHR